MGCHALGHRFFTCRAEAEPEALGCVIESGAHIEHAVLFDYTYISAHASVRNGLVIDGFFMDSEGNCFDVNETGVEWLVSDSRILRKDLTLEQAELLQMISDC